jgi:hypothetical protein
MILFYFSKYNKFEWQYSTINLWFGKHTIQFTQKHYSSKIRIRIIFQKVFNIWNNSREWTRAPRGMGWDYHQKFRPMWNGMRQKVFRPIASHPMDPMGLTLAKYLSKKYNFRTCLSVRLALSNSILFHLVFHHFIVTKFKVLLFTFTMRRHVSLSLPM